MSKEDRPKKVKFDKFYTRSKSQKLLAKGADPAATFKDDKGNIKGRFTNHPNYHIRAYAWRKMGCPLPEDAGERAKFLASIRVKEKTAAPNATVEVVAENTNG